ncbi:hypothetical protein K466DRAFT_257617 [Polyporus arcularius HHB13444]|uniref:Uncharacterized protein n=2 Tax=Polyporaceae TaxID=5317 RepID=A0A5C3P1P8_9APHY|nr:hypothetical protein K466DRAFT_257617 [Polyporus arcularius HHB13444]
MYATSKSHCLLPRNRSLVSIMFLACHALVPQFSSPLLYSHLSDVPHVPHRILRDQVRVSGRTLITLDVYLVYVMPSALKARSRTRPYPLTMTSDNLRLCMDSRRFNTRHSVLTLHPPSIHVV